MNPMCMIEEIPKEEGRIFEKNAGC